MADFYLNLSLSKWPKHSLHAKAEISRGDPVRKIVCQLTGFADVIASGELDVGFLIDHVGTYMQEALASNEPYRFSKVYGDDSIDSTDWRLYIDGITDAEIARQDEFDLLGLRDASRQEVVKAIFVRNERGDVLTRMVRMDEELGLLDAPDQDGRE